MRLFNNISEFDFFCAVADPTCIYLPVLDLAYIFSQLRCDGLVCVYEVDPRALRVERGCCGPLQDGRQFPHQFKLPSTRARLNLREVKSIYNN